MTDEPLWHVLEFLERLGVAYMLTGSYASNAYGKVRSTFDADLVIAIQASQMKSLARELEKEFYLDSRTLAEAREAGGQFNAVHKSSGLKLDFYLMPGDEHSRSAMARRRRHDLAGRQVWVIAPEDLILAKLAWAKSGGSKRQIEDAHGVFEVQRASLDMEYLRAMAKALSLETLLNEVTKQ